MSCAAWDIRRRPSATTRAAVAIAQQAGQRYHLTLALVGLGATLRMVDNQNQALRVLQSAVELAVQDGYSVVEGQACAVIACLHLDGSDPTSAAQYARHAVNIQRRTGHRLGEALALDLLARARHRAVRAACSDHCHHVVTMIWVKRSALPAPMDGDHDRAPGPPRQPDHADRVFGCGLVRGLCR